MKTAPATRTFRKPRFVMSASLCLCLATVPLVAGQQGAAGAPRVAGAAAVKAFTTPKQATDALIAAATAFDIGALQELFGPEFEEIVLPGDDYAQGRQRAADFVAKAKEKTSVSVDPATGTRAFLLVGDEDWPFPVPMVKRSGRWSFDAPAGRQEIKSRRIGRNELDAIEICRGYVEAQHEYALEKREGFAVNQYAQRIISTPGTQDGLAWRTSEGTWEGPIGEAVAKAIEQGYTNRAEPYHGYFFKILKGQGPAAPLGQMDYVVNNVMIGGFALVAAPAAYGVTGIKTFLVSHDGVVYEKDFGRATLETFKKIERFNPDSTWSPVEEP
jgi:hypothetical protein